MTPLQATGAFISLEESQPSSAELSIVANSQYGVTGFDALTVG